MILAWNVRISASYESKLNGFEVNYNGLDDSVRKSGLEILCFSAD